MSGPLTPVPIRPRARDGGRQALNDIHAGLTGPDRLSADGVAQSRLVSALDLISRGWHVFPCVPGGKRPALRGDWRRLATASPAQVRDWWARAPYNIGISCGPSGLVVIDLDTDPGDRARRDDRNAGGAGALASLCARHGQPLPLPTHAVGTPSGGIHLYYAAPHEPVRNSAGRLGSLIDVRAAGGYVIGASSSIAGRRYTAWDQRAPVPLPQWITALLRAGPPAAAAAGGQRLPVVGSAHGTAYAMAALREETRLVRQARPGSRNDTLNRAAFSLGQLTAAGLLPALPVATALASAAEQAGLPAGEARRTIRSGMTAGTRCPREIPPSSAAP